MIRISKSLTAVHRHEGRGSRTSGMIIYLRSLLRASARVPAVCPDGRSASWCTPPDRGGENACRGDWPSIRSLPKNGSFNA